MHQSRQPAYAKHHHQVRRSYLSPSLRLLLWMALSRILPVVLLFSVSRSVYVAYHNGFFDASPISGLFDAPPDEKLVILITPTYRRLERIADLTRMAQTLSHVGKLHWIVVEDANTTYPYVDRILQRSTVPYLYFAAPTAPGMPPRGWTQRNIALQYVRQNYHGKTGVLYFADDDNTYDVRLFDNYIRKVKRIGFWAVGLVGGAYVEAPNVVKGKINSWNVVFAKQRQFATDMAGFAIHVDELRRVGVTFDDDCVKQKNIGPESCFLSKFGLKKEQLQAFGTSDIPKEVLVWHTKSVRSTASGDTHGYIIQ